MAFKSSLKLDSKFFSQAERRRAFATVVSESAKEFKTDLKNKMITSPHTGKETTRGKAGFTRTRRASRRGERPRPDTFELVNSVTSGSTGELSAKTEVEAEHGAILQAGGRPVMNAEDVSEANSAFKTRARRALLSLL